MTDLSGHLVRRPAGRSATAQVAASGHRVVPTVPLTIEGWGPTRAAALTELLTCLVETLVDDGLAATSEPVPLRIDAGADDEMAADLIAEVLGLIEALGVVPLRAVVEDVLGGGVLAYVDVAPAEHVARRVPAPTEVVRHEVWIGDDGERWWCRARLLTD